MKDEIKETINILYEFATNINSDYIYDAQGFDYPLISDCIEELLDYITNLQDKIKQLEQINEEHRKINGELREENERLTRSVVSYDETLLKRNNEYEDYKTRNEKAIEYINHITDELTVDFWNDKTDGAFEDLLNILQNGGNNER